MAHGSRLQRESIVPEEDKAYKRVLAWQKAEELAFACYRLGRVFPPQESTLGPEIRRVSLLIPSRVAVAHTLRGKEEAYSLVREAMVAVKELEQLLSFARKLKYAKEATLDKIEALRSEVDWLLTDFHSALGL